MAVAAARQRARLEAQPRTFIQRSSRVGLGAGAISIYLGAVGIAQAFDERAVVAGIISLGRTMLVAVPLVAGYFVARPPKIRAGEPEPPAPPIGIGLSAGAIAGGINGVLVAIFLLFADAFDVREIFTSISSTLVEMLAFGGENAVAGAGIQIASGIVLGALGAAVHLLSPANRRPFLFGVGAVLFVSLFSRMFEDVITGTGDFIRLVFLDDTDWLIENDGLTILGTILVFGLTAGYVAFSARRGNVVKAKIDSLPAAQRQGVKIALFLLLVVFLAILPQVAGRFLSSVLGTVGIYVLLGLGLNIVIGYAGLLDLGYVAFFAIGAYTTAMLTSPASFAEGPLNFWAAVPIVMVVATICGVLIGAPVLRLRGDYLAIVTLGFGEIVRILVISEWLRDKTGGAQGILSIPDPAIGTLAFDSSEMLYYLILVCCIGAAFVANRLQDSRIGRSWVAMREDEQVAEAMGISIIKTKLLAFAMGAAIGSFSGMFFAVKIGSVFPNSMSILVSILVLAVIVLGGMGSIPGVIVGAFVLVGLPEILREFEEFRLLVYGAILVAIMILRPEGLIPSARRRFELHEVEEEQILFEERHGEDVEEGAPVVVAASPKDMT